MNEIRCFEEKAWTLFTENKLRGSVHLCTGQEAIAATVCSNLEDADYITSTHRGHGHCIAKGARLDFMLAELMGKATGYCKGRGGSMHIADFEKGNLGANAIVGGGIPIAAGAALAQKMKGERHVTVSFFGDGASNEGAAHEAMNLASIWKLPVIFVCENNGYGMSSPVEETTSVKDISIRAAGYSMPGETVDGNEVAAIDEAFRRAKKRALDGEGPAFLECRTYRWRGHWTGDPEPYRTREEVAAWREKCPIKRFWEYLISNGVATEAELDGIIKKANEAMDAAVRFALDSPEPDPAQVLEDVFYIGA